MIKVTKFFKEIHGYTAGQHDLEIILFIKYLHILRQYLNT